MKNKQGQPIIKAIPKLYKDNYRVENWYKIDCIGIDCGDCVLSANARNALCIPHNDYEKGKKYLAEQIVKAGN